MKRCLCWVLALCMLAAMPSAMMEGALSDVVEPVVDVLENEPEGIAQATDDLASEPLEAPVEEVGEFELTEEEEELEISTTGEEALFAGSHEEKVLYYEDCTYKVNKGFRGERTPYDSGNWNFVDKGILRLSGTIHSTEVWQNSYGNKWLKFDEGFFYHYVYAGTDEYISFDKANVSNDTLRVHNTGFENNPIIYGGNRHTFYGGIYSNFTIRSVQYVIKRKSDSKKMISKTHYYDTPAPLNNQGYTSTNRTTLDYSIYLKTPPEIENYFIEIPTGSYILQIYVVYIYNRGMDSNYKVFEYPFSVTNYRSPNIVTPTDPVETPNYDSFRFSNVTYPKNFKIDTRNGWFLQGGTVSSDAGLKTIRSDILISGGSTITTYGPIGISGASYAVKGIDSGVLFNKITSEGNYIWRLTATDGANRTLVLDMPFYASYSSGTSTTTASKTYQNMAYLDVNGWLNGSYSGGLENFGTVDVYINGKCVANDVSDFYTQYNEGTSYQIKDIKAKSGYVYKGVYSGSLSGTIGSSTANVVLMFNKEEAQPVNPTGVALDKKSLSLTEGDSATLKATVSPSNAKKNVTWSSSNSAVAKVDANGKVTAVKKGTANITVATDNKKTAICTVTVAAAPDATSVKLSHKGTVELGLKSNLTLTATVAPSNAKTTLTWTSSNASVATVSAKGVVTGVKEGTATITVKTSNNKKATVNVKVIDLYTPKSIAFSVKSADVNVNKTCKLVWTLQPATAKTTVTFKSSNVKVATVDAKGVVKGIKEGSAKITATTTNGKKATISIKVVDLYTPKSIAFTDKKVTIKVGNTYATKYTLKPNTAQTSVTYSSSNKSVATVDAKGVIKGVKKGTATITVTTANGKKTTIKVTVKQ